MIFLLMVVFWLAILIAYNSLSAKLVWNWRLSHDFCAASRAIILKIVMVFSCASS